MCSCLGTIPHTSLGTTFYWWFFLPSNSPSHDLEFHVLKRKEKEKNILNKKERKETPRNSPTLSNASVSVYVDFLVFLSHSSLPFCVPASALSLSAPAPASARSPVAAWASSRPSFLFPLLSLTSLSPCELSKWALLPLFGTLLSFPTMGACPSGSSAWSGSFCAKEWYPRGLLVVVPAKGTVSVSFVSSYPKSLCFCWFDFHAGLLSHPPQWHSHPGSQLGSCGGRPAAIPSPRCSVLLPTGSLLATGCQVRA